jgi:hypothetical protein
MSQASPLPFDRFVATLDIVARKCMHLAWSRTRLTAQPIDAAWVTALDKRPERAERLEALFSRFARLQDTIADKLLPRLLLALAENPGSQIETLNRAERLSVVADVTRWLEARQLRNRLVHEYMTDPAAFAADLNLAASYSIMLINTAQRAREQAAARLHLDPDVLPAVPSAG